jgi:hypothetical protein
VVLGGEVAGLRVALRATVSEREVRERLDRTGDGDPTGEFQPAFAAGDEKAAHLRRIPPTSGGRGTI